jgi:glycosyltransferase involved in cell wall biosynthesis
VSGDVLYFHTWYRGHNNARYAELLPRLARVDATLLTYPGPRVARALCELAWRAVRPAAEPSILRRLQRTHRYAFVTDVGQLRSLSVPAVVDVDDPVFTEETARLLDRAAALVVTAPRVGERLEELGVRKPFHVVPQGVARETLDGFIPRPNGRPTVGYLAAFLLLPGDRGGDNPLYDVTHLLELWDEIVEHSPGAVLELAGRASPALRRRLQGRGDVVLLGALPRPALLPVVAAWDVALYPRSVDQGVRASKIAEYLGAGVPIVSYDYQVVSDVRDAGAGILVGSPREFVEAVVGLLASDDRRAELAACSRAAGEARDWRVLAQQYAAILDEHLPRLD